jgi:formylglycine-generating enzyme
MASVNSSRLGVVFPELLLVPAGWFWMGSESGQENEWPLHRVWVDAFHLAKCQVTNADYEHFVQATNAELPPFWNDTNLNRPAQPVVGVSWFEATRYCQWLSQMSGKNFRLPSEAEWERAARGGAENRAFPWGDDPPQSLPDYDKRWRTGPETVGTRPANGFGLHDMCENVHEWCSDRYQANYYVTSPERNPQGPETGERRSSRGGSWRHHVKVSRCAARSSIPPDFHYADYGFRVACSAE